MKHNGNGNKRQTHTLERKSEPETTPNQMWMIDRIDIVSGGDADTGVIDEVAVLIKEVQGRTLSVPLCASFKAPGPLKVFIEELIAFRSSVWPDAEPINPDAELEDTDAARHPHP